MGYPRAYTVDPDHAGFYHCVSRCVRRAWLCGQDPVSGRCFEHRRGWIEQRLLSLAESFAVGLYAWAVLSNHTHVVLRIDPRLPQNWTDEEIARRWARLDRKLEPVPQDQVAQRVERLLRQPERIAELRTRLGNLSWFMRYLNEGIARAANGEDRCGGRFWEGRYRSQALLDDAAVTACMAYVDLNPIRAGIADELADSEFTSIQRRLRSLEADPQARDALLEPLAGVRCSGASRLTVGAYIDLVDCTGRMMRPGKRGSIPDHAVAALAAIRGSPAWWTGCVSRIEAAFGSVVGVPRTLRQRAEETGRRCLRGAGASC